MGRYNVSPNHRVENCCQLLDAWFVMMVWLLGFHQFLNFVFPCNFLKFWHFKQIMSRKLGMLKNNLITTKLENVLWYLITFVCKAYRLTPSLFTYIYTCKLKAIPISPFPYRTRKPQMIKWLFISVNFPPWKEEGSSAYTTLPEVCITTPSYTSCSVYVYIPNIVLYNGSPWIGDIPKMWC